MRPRLLTRAATRTPALAIVLALAGCTGSAADLQWSGADTGRATLPARAAWCAESRSLVLFATAGDTGLALVVYPADSVLGGSYRVFAAPAGVTRPGAAIGLRWNRHNTMADYRAARGGVTVQRAGEQVNGTLAASAYAVSGAGSLSVSGRFRGVALRQGGADCAGHAGVD